MAAPIEIDMWQGEIAELEVDAIVIPANETLFMTAPAARGVKLRAGEAVERESVGQGPVPAGTAVVTGAGVLPALHVIHAVGVGHDLQPDRARLGSALEAVFEIAARMGLNRLASALIGTERGVFTPAEAVAALATVVRARAERDAWLPDGLVIVAASAAELQAIRAGVDALRAAVA